MGIPRNQIARLAVAFVLAASFSASINAVAAVPSGATASLSALRQAYIDATQSHDAASLEALFDMTLMEGDRRSRFVQDFKNQDLKKLILEVVIRDPEPGIKVQYARDHAYFLNPIVKVMEVDFAGPPGTPIGGSEYFITYAAGRYYFIVSQGGDAAFKKRSLRHGL